MSTAFSPPHRAARLRVEGDPTWTGGVTLSHCFSIPSLGNRRRPVCCGEVGWQVCAPGGEVLGREWGPPE